MSRLAEFEPLLVPSRSAPSSPRTPRRSAPGRTPAPEQAAHTEATEALDAPLVRPLRRPDRTRRKPAPRRTEQVRPAVLKVASGIITTTVVLTLAASMIRVAAEPLMVTYHTGLEVQGLRGVLTQERSANAALMADIAYLKTTSGVEQEARRRGWVRPGEVALSIVDTSAPEAPEAAGEQPAAPRKMSVADRIRTTLESCLAVFGSKDGH